MADITGIMGGLDERIDREIDAFFGSNLPAGKAGIPFEAEVGTCRGAECKGKIVYRLEWKQGSLPPDIPLGLWSAPRERILVCSCKRCGMMYDTSHSRYKDIFEKAYAEFIKGI